MNIKQFFEYISRPVVPVAGDIELKAGMWHLNHFAISLLITLFAGALCEWITGVIFGYWIAAVWTFVPLLVKEIRETRYRPILNEGHFTRYFVDVNYKIEGIEVFEIIKRLTDYPGFIYEHANGKKTIFQKSVEFEETINYWTVYSDPWAEVKDSFTDLNQYASCFLVPLWAYGLHWWAVGLFAVILTVYVVTGIKGWCKP